MALVSIEIIDTDTLLGIWQIDEEDKGETVRQRERNAVLRLLHAMTGDDSLTIGHQPDGKPILDGRFISISHTRGYAAVMLSTAHEVGIDIEYYSDRVSRIASRFLRADEEASTVSSQIVHWSAKETIYKYFSAQKLQFADMRVTPFCVAESGVLEVENLRTSQRQRVQYRVNASYVLTFTLM